MLTEYHWLYPLIATGLIWAVAILLPSKTPDVCFECRPMYEVSVRTTVASFLTIVMWLAFVALELRVFNHG